MWYNQTTKFGGDSLILLLAAVIIAFGFGVYWLAGKYILLFKADIKRTKFRIIRAAIAVLLTAVCTVIRMGLLIVLHLLVLWGICELTRIILRSVLKHRKETKPYSVLRIVYRCGIVPIVLIAVLFTYGYFNMNTVHKTQYTVTSKELSRDYRVVFLSDTHYGTIQDPELLKEKVDDINALNPDFVILGGDIVEEGTDKAEMTEVFETLGKIDSTYGTFFVYGNHDRQRYTSDPEYTEEELAQTINQNGITILKENFVDIGDDILLVGREDLSARDERLEADALLNGADTDRFILVADHQPNNVKSNTSYGADLQLSGHTHGGQMLPLGWMSFMYNGYVYGQYQEVDTDVIVSSGFAGWGFSIRTQGISEYVVVDLLAE